jgi:hypothetical protein
LYLDFCGDDRQFYQYQTILPISIKQTTSKQWWSTIPLISTKQTTSKQLWSTIPPICFIDIGRIVDHHCLEVVVCFVDIGGINDHHCLEVVVCFVDIGGIIWYWWNCRPSPFRGGCLFCWYWWN